MRRLGSFVALALAVGCADDTDGSAGSAASSTSGAGAEGGASGSGGSVSDRGGGTSRGGAGGLGGSAGSSTGGSGGAVGCDGTGVCGDTRSGCIACAKNGVCQGAWAACETTPDCEAFEQCFFDCNGDRNCEDACVEDHLQGAEVWVAFHVCAVCMVCPNDCAPMASGC